MRAWLLIAFAADLCLDGSHAAAYRDGRGGTINLCSGRSAAFGGLRKVFIGGLAAADTFAIGTLFGVAMG